MAAITMTMITSTVNCSSMSIRTRHHPAGKRGDRDVENDGLAGNDLGHGASSWSAGGIGQYQAKSYPPTRAVVSCRGRRRFRRRAPGWTGPGSTSWSAAAAACPASEVDELVAAYQRTATQLSVLRTAGADPALTARLSARLARARAAAVGGAHASGWRSVSRFFAVSFPAHGLPGPVVVAGDRGRLAAGRPPGRLVGGAVTGSAGQPGAEAAADQLREPSVPRLLLAVQRPVVRLGGMDAQCVPGRRDALVSGMFLGIPTLFLCCANAPTSGWLAADWSRTDGPRSSSL